MRSVSPPDAPRRIVRCPAWGRSEPVSAQDLAGYMASGWPRCCGQVMAYYLEAAPPAATGTRFTHTCPVCGGEWAITFPPGVQVPADAGAVCERCRAQSAAADRHSVARPPA